MPMAEASESIQSTQKAGQFRDEERYTKNSSNNSNAHKVEKDQDMHLIITDLNLPMSFSSLLCPQWGKDQADGEESSIRQ